MKDLHTSAGTIDTQPWITHRVPFADTFMG